MRRKEGQKPARQSYAPTRAQSHPSGPRRARHARPCARLTAAALRERVLHEPNLRRDEKNRTDDDEDVVDLVGRLERAAVVLCEPADARRRVGVGGAEIRVDAAFAATDVGECVGDVGKEGVALDRRAGAESSASSPAMMKRSNLLLHREEPSAPVPHSTTTCATGPNLWPPLSSSSAFHSYTDSLHHESASSPITPNNFQTPLKSIPCLT